MKYCLVVRPEADADLREIEAWYDRQQRGLGARFVRATYDAIEGLLGNPLAHRVRHRRKQVRWIHPKTFPYRIIYRVVASAIVVYAVIHTARHDREWTKRL